MDLDIEKSALSTSISNSPDVDAKDEQTSLLVPDTPLRKRRYALFLLVLLLVPSAVFCVYSYHNLWRSAASFNLDFFGFASPDFPSTFNGNAAIQLHPEQHAFRKPKTIIQHWHVTKEKRAPDGVEKEIFLINGQFPGPTLEACSGDTLIIEVHNQVLSSSSDDNEDCITIHWHGLYMRNGNNCMDGVAAFTQSCIRLGESFVYNFTIDPSQSGTFWYHAHSEVHRGDGMFGGLVVHKPASEGISEQIQYGYQEEVLLMVGDWYHRPAKELLMGYLGGTGNGDEHRPASIMINGRGKFPCSQASSEPANSVQCLDVAEPWIYSDPRKKYRYRVVNVGYLYEFTLALPETSGMSVIQVDGGQQLQDPYPASSAGILYPGERMDVIVGWSGSPDGKADLATSMIIVLERPTMGAENPALSPIQVFPIRSHPRYQSSSTSKLPSLNTTTLLDKTIPFHFDLTKAQSPKLITPLPEKSDKEMTLTARLQPLPLTSSSSSHGTKGLLNSTSWAPQSSPLITLPRTEWDANQFIPWTGPTPIWVDLLVHNLDANGHPFHLHGFDFYVLESGPSNLDLDGNVMLPTIESSLPDSSDDVDGNNALPSTPRSIPTQHQLNLLNPRKKDTVQIDGNSFVRIRFYADNEGIWTFHCHVLWHQGVGMAMGVQVLGDESGVFPELREAAT